MLKLKHFVIYTGAYLWGWRMIGIGWKTTWFFGVSINTRHLGSSEQSHEVIRTDFA